MIEHWVHLRCAGMRLEQYTDTWTCHIHTESGLTTHTDITPLQTLFKSPYPFPTHTTQTTATRIHTHTSNTLTVPTELVNLKPNPLIHSPKYLYGIVTSRSELGVQIPTYSTLFCILFENRSVLLTSRTPPHFILPS